MVEVLVAVEATAGSPFTPNDGAETYDLLWAGSSPLSGYPVGEGHVPDSLAGDGEPAAVLLLMEEPARPGVSVRARPVALLHQLVDGRPCDEVVCVPVGDAHFASLTGPEALCAWHADTDALTAVLRRFRPGHTCEITACENRAAAETFLAEAQHSYERLTGSLE